VFLSYRHWTLQLHFTWVPPSNTPPQPIARPIYDETYHTFAVSTLVSSSRSTPPILNIYIPPHLCWTQKTRWAVGRPFVVALGARWGSTRCGSQWPSFGCLILLWWTNGLRTCHTISTSVAQFFVHRCWPCFSVRIHDIIILSLPIDITVLYYLTFQCILEVAVHENTLGWSTLRMFSLRDSDVKC
jgi:hypothetical protein